MHEFEQIEDAFIERLETLKAIGLETLETYSGQMNIEDMDDLTIQFPCIYVIAGGLQLEGVNRYDKYSAAITMLVGDSHIRGSVAAARGDASSPGVYELLKTARGLLHNKKLIPGWTPPQVTSEAPLIYAPEKNICIYTAEYSMRAVK